MVKTLPYAEAVRTLSLPGLERNLFSSERWLSMLDATYRLRLFIKYIERGGSVSSYIIYSVVHNFLENKICICSYCDYCDCYIENKNDWDLFFESLREEYPKYRIVVRNLRDTTARQSPHFQLLSKEWFHYLDVRDDLPVIWKRTHDSFKNAVKQAEKGGITVRPCGKEGLKLFYNLHMRLRKNKYRLFPQPYRFFDGIWRAYMDKGQGVLLGAFDGEGHFVGGTIFLICGNTLYYKFNTSDLTRLKARPNNLLVWEGVKLAKSRGLEYLDMGSSGYEQHGLILFKDHAGATKLEINHLGFAPPGYKFSRKIILGIMTRFFTMPWMPNCMLRLGSSLIYPYLA